MAVRIFDLTEPQSTLQVLDAAPRRQHVRRTKQRYAIVGVASLAFLSSPLWLYLGWPLSSQAGGALSDTVTTASCLGALFDLRKTLLNAAVVATKRSSVSTLSS